MSTLRTGMLSWWSLEEASGIRVDSHDGRNLSEVGVVAQGIGKVGNCAQWTTFDQTKRLENASTALDFGYLQDFSVACWFYRSTFDTHQIVSRTSTTGGYRLFINSAANRFRFEVGSTIAQADFFGNVPINTWLCVICRYQGTGNQRAYISVNNSTSDPSLPVTSNFSIGSGATFQVGSTTRWLAGCNGRVDEVAVWNRLISAGEMTEYYNSGNGIAYAQTGGFNPGRYRNNRLVGIGI